MAQPTSICTGSRARRGLVVFIGAIVMAFSGAKAAAFCGFFVAQADAKLFNSASQVVIVHDAGKTVLTMVNNYRGEPKAFALVVPVPTVLKKEMVRVTDIAAIDHLDRFSAPRLAEYFDPDPCAPPIMYESRRRSGAVIKDAAAPARADALGVKIEASYTVGEYDIVILRANQSDGLETWLRQNGYTIPAGAAQALAPYIRSEMKFFVAKVNLANFKATGFEKLRPLQFAYKDPRFMLPVRLGMINAEGPQDLIAYVITKQFRTETVNYRNPKLPSNLEVPTYIKKDFSEFYKAMFEKQVRELNGRAVFTEYAWNMGWCDPCADQPLSATELQQLGVWWIQDPQQAGRWGGGVPAFVTRLHARYTRETFPEDLMLKVTQDNSNFQGRYVLRHPYTGPAHCEQAKSYYQTVLQRRDQEVTTLASLTGWPREKIHQRLEPLPPQFGSREKNWLDGVREFFGE